MKRAEVQSSGEYPIVKSYSSVPEAPRKGARVKTKFCGICHSDLHLWENATPDKTFPIVYGHEISGQISSFGPDADKHGGLSVGDNVAVYPWFGCGACEICHAGQHNHCNDRSKEIGCGADGGYSDHVVVPDTKFLVRIPASIQMDVACMLPCSGLTSYTAVMRAKPYIPKENGRILVIGAGGLGLWCLQWLTHRMPPGTKFVSADINKEKLDLALDHGAHDTVLLPKCTNGMDSGKERLLMDELHQKSNGGFNAVVDFVNSSDSSTRGFAALKKKGIHIAVGMFGGNASLDLLDAVRKMKTFTGSYVGSLSDLKDLIHLVSSFQVKPPPISHCKVSEVADIWRRLADGKVRGRCLIKHD